MRDNSCSDCAKITSGDCGKHGYRIYGMETIAVTWMCPRCMRIHHIFKQTCDCLPPYENR